MLTSAFSQINDCYSSDTDIDALLNESGDLQNFQIESIEPEKIRVIVLDGFRTPLNYSNKLLVCTRDESTAAQLHFIDLENFDHSSTIHWPNAALPSFYWELDAAGEDARPVRDFVKATLSYWALQPKVQADLLIRHWKVLDKRQKTVVRLSALSFDGVEALQEQQFVHISPVRGFDKAHRQVESVLKSYCVEQTAVADQLQTLLASIAESDFTPQARLNAEDDAYHACCRLLQAAQGEMIAHTQGLVDDIDTEFLHQYRVNLRKTRSLIKECKKVFAQDDLTLFKAFFKRLSDLTTPVRDYDVHVLMIEEWVRSNASNPIVMDIKPLYDLIKQKRQRAFRKLVRYLQSTDYASDMEAWANFLEAAIADPSRKMGENIGRYAAKRIRRCYRRLIMDGLKLSHQSEDEEFHEIRLDFKRLRYLFEYFQPIFPGKKYKSVYKLTKRIQSVLGDFQDITVQKSALLDYADELTAKKTESRTFLCLGQLLQETGGNHDALKQQYHALFAQLYTAENEQFIAGLNNLTITKKTVRL